MSTVTVVAWRFDPTDGACTSLGTLSTATNAQWTDILSEPGSGSVTIQNDDSLWDDLGFDGLDLVQFLVDGVPAWVMVPDPATITYGEGGKDQTTLSGPGLLSLLGRMAVYPAGGVGRRPKQQQRLFGWAAPDYDLTGFDNAKVILLTSFAKLTWAGAAFGVGWAADFPLDGFSVIYWADNPGGNTSDYLTADAGEVWFFRDVDYPNDGLYRHYFAADDFAEVFLDGVLILSTETYTSTTTSDVEVTSGTHRIAIKARNGTGTSLDAVPGFYVGPGGISLEISELSLVSETFIGLPSGDLYVVAYEDNPPGVAPISMLITLLEEAEARGCVPITLSFDATDDTDSNAWDAEAEPVAQIGGTLSEVQRDLSGEIDFSMSADLTNDGLTLNAWRYGEKGSASGETLTKGSNLEGLTHRRENMPTTAVIVETTNDWLEVTDTGAITSYGRSEAALSLGDVVSSQEAERVAEGQLAIFSVPREEILASVHDTGAIAYVDFEVGDTVTVPDSTGTSAAERCVAISVSVDEQTNRAVFACSFRDVILGPEDRMAVTIGKL